MGQNTTNLNSSAILRGIGSLLRSKEAPYRLLVSDTYDIDQAATVSLERQALEIVAQEGVAGAIVVHNGGPDTVPTLRAVQERGIPLVFVDRFPNGMRCDFVGVDNFASAQEAVQHLLDLGHRRIAHLTTQDPVTTVLQREEGYRETLRGAGIPPRPEWTYRAERYAGQMEMNAALDHFFGLAEPPTALFVVNDALAHYFIAMAEERGYGVPEAISVVGFDNYDRYSPRPPVLTTIDQSFEQVGRRAAELLLNRIAEAGPDATPYQHILLPTRLIVRATTRSLAD
jgi:DNA-binding LacI/PurR family transcriptional regulator